MSQTQEEIVLTFFDHILIANYDRAKDFMVGFCESYYEQLQTFNNLFFRKNNVQRFCVTFGLSR